ncbi:MAG: hypothetical protein EOP46_05310 [Sphingobacteriaceae bacterium]|nr:MAG: hypothetical protein EOP46_05310 [Sphingobacteriaceae bacterium]
MTTTDIRERLKSYIDYADDKKVQAIYTMVEEEINERYNWWDDKALLKELDNRIKEIELLPEEGRTWDEVKAAARKL